MTRGDRIKLRRESLGITQTALAERIGVTKQQMYKYENGVITNIPSDKIEAIAVALNVSPSYLMGWEDTSGSDSEQLSLSGTYLRLAKGAQELGLDDEDVDAILALYKKHRQRND